jgi:thioesterase DpgC
VVTETAGGLAAAAERWRATVPWPAGALDHDAAGLARYTAEGEHLISQLPSRKHRDEQQQLLAAIIFGACRDVRDQFINTHADQVYDTLTDSRTEYRRLPELLSVAAARFPGLLPDEAQLRAESETVQMYKEGREIDQGIFVRGLLRSPAAGAHLMRAMRLPTVRGRTLTGQFRQVGRVDLGSVTIERKGRTAHLTINNLACLNAEDNALTADLETAVDLALLDDGIRVGVLRGGIMTHPRYAGRRVFSAGLNLAHLRDGKISFAEFLIGRELGYLSKIVRGQLAISPPDGSGPAIQKPWIAAIDSFAIGGGMQVALAVDWVIAASDAYFSLPAAQEGIVPGVANLRLAGLTGGRLARRIILGGYKVLADTPEGRLLCDEVVPQAQVGAAIDAAVRMLDPPAVIANRAMLNLAVEPEDRFQQYLAEFAFVQAHRLYSPDVLKNASQRRRPNDPGPTSAPRRETDPE